MQDDYKQNDGKLYHCAEYLDEAYQLLENNLFNLFQKPIFGGWVNLKLIDISSIQIIYDMLFIKK